VHGWQHLTEIRSLADELDEVRFSARNPFCVLVSLEIGAGLLTPTGARGGPRTMRHLRQPNETYQPSVLRYTTLQPRESEQGGLWLSVGRTSDNDIVVNDYAVSRRHARFRQVAGAGFVIEDVGSVNGTALDGAWITPNEQTRLRSGQSLRFGRLAFTFLKATDFHTFLVTLVPLG
jgi:hypothetical protein